MGNGDAVLERGRRLPLALVQRVCQPARVHVRVSPPDVDPASSSAGSCSDVAWDAAGEVTTVVSADMGAPVGLAVDWGMVVVDASRAK